MKRIYPKIHHCFLLLFILFCGQASAETYPTVIGKPGQWQQQFTAFGQVMARTETTIRLPFALKVTKVQINPGQHVSSGDVLLHFKAPHLLQNLQKYAHHRTLILLAKQQQNVIRQGVMEHTITRNEVVRAKQQFVQYDVQKKQSWNAIHTDLMMIHNKIKQQDLDLLLDRKSPQDVADILAVLKAPFTGIVINRPPQAGLWIQAATPLFELEDLHQVYIQVAVSEQALQDWQDGETLIETRDKSTLILQPLTGEPGIDPASGMRLVLFTLDNRKTSYRDGQWLQVKHLGPTRSVLWIPAAAVVNRNNKTWCIIKKDQHFTPRPIKTGTPLAGRIPILSGLGARQQVVIENSYELLYQDLKKLVQFVD